MKKNNLILTIAITLIIYFIFIFFFRGLSKTFNLDWTKDTGTLGDTLGGFLSPLIGLAGFYFIYETFKAQREQLKEQREQYHVNRITDIIYRQFERVNESIKSQTFLFYNLGVNEQEKIQGYAGLYSLNETINRLLVFPELNLAEIPKRLEKFIADNLIQLIDIYENVNTAGTIVESLIEESKINPEKSHNDLRVLLVLNLGDAVKKNITEIRRYMDMHKRNSSDLDNIYDNEIRVQKLDGLVNGAYTLFENVLDSSETIRNAAEQQ